MAIFPLKRRWPGGALRVCLRDNIGIRGLLLTNASQHQSCLPLAADDRIWTIGRVLDDQPVVPGTGAALATTHSVV